MARLAAVEKGEYYPTPLSVVDDIASYLHPARGHRGVIRLFDPCVGEGRALEALARAVARRTNLPVQTWGVEISPDRAEEAATRLGLVIQAPFEAVSWSPVRYGIASVLFLNPPYDHGTYDRMELEFLKMAMPALITGGVLAYIIPTTAVNYSMAEYLYKHFEDIRVFRFGDADDESGFDRFKQIVILATRRKQSLKSLYYDEAARDAVHNFVEAYSELYSYRREQPLKELIPTVLPEGTTYTVPVARKAARLRRYRYTDDEIIALVASGWSKVETEIAETLLASDAELPQPLMPPKTGHIAQIVAAGLAGVIEADGKVFKGRVVKVTEVQPDPEDPSKEIARDRYETHVVSVSPQGLHHLDQPSAVEEFLQRHIGVFKRYITENFWPYGNNTTPAEARVLDTLSLDKQLPGVARRGLLPKQREVAVALTRAIRRYSVGHLVAEMGFGKTRTALAAIELMGAYPALVICPPHLVDKWAREATAAVSGAEAHIVESIGELEWLRSQYRPGQKLVVIASRSKIKLGPGWHPASAVRYTLPHDKGDRERLREALERYREARNALGALKDLEKQGLGPVDEETLEEQRRITAKARRRALDAAIPYPVCPICGQVQVKKKNGAEEPILDFRPFTKKVHTCDRPVQGWARDEDGRRKRDDDGRPVWAWDAEEKNAPRCGSALYSFGGENGHRRWPIADYISAKAKGFFQMLVADEVHQYKGKASDRGLAFHRLINATRWQLALTGTFYGGKSTSIFWLMHRLRIDRVQQDFPYNGERKWAARYGVLETRIYGGKNAADDDDFGTFNATRRRKVVVQEKPGVSPAILSRIIGNSIFLSLKDLGVALPPYKEEVALVQMGKEQTAQYTEMEGLLRAKARKDARYLSTWLQWSLNRPNSAFRDEVIVKEFRDDDGNLVKKECLGSLPAVVDNAQLLQKEEWLADYCKAEVAAGRKVLVYVRQTGTRDIQPRLKGILQDAGLRAEVLYSNSDPRKREKWIKRHADGIDVLIVNPRLVETGLDLVQFSTVVFYEIEYSLYTMWQAMRRVWRLGQSKPVKVIFTAYAGTLEEQAMSLMGQKMHAAQLLYGDEVGGAIVPEEDGNFLTELARAVLEEKKLPSLKTLFAAAKQETTSALGSPTAQSPRLRYFTDEELQALLKAERETRARRRRRRKVPECQLPLF